MISWAGNWNPSDAQKEQFSACTDKLNQGAVGKLERKAPRKMEQEVRAKKELEATDLSWRKLPMPLLN